MTDKTEKATPYKLLKAKEKGQVSKSSELVNSLSLFVILGLLLIAWPRQLTEVKELAKELLISAATYPLTLDKLIGLNQLILSKLLNLWLPLGLSAVLTTILATLIQTGFVWSTAPLAPDFKRLNPIKGLQKFHSIKTLFDALKSILKVLVASLALYLILKSELAAIFQLALKNPAANYAMLINKLLLILIKLLLVCMVFALADTLFTRWKYLRDQRMSKQDIKDELTQREGNPKIKAKIKQLQYQLRQKTASLKQVQQADVVITNPTHLAIALTYDKQSMPAPKVVCKAQNELAKQVKQLAKKHGVPLIENKLFARALYKSVALNQCISPELFPVAAGIFREIYKQRKPQ